MKEDQAYLPLLVFFASYLGLFYLGAMGMQLDAKGYFEDWVASIGIQEAYLDAAQSWAHLVGIHLPFFGLGLGALMAQRTAGGLFTRIRETLRNHPTGSMLFLGAFCVFGLLAGSFALNLAFFLVFCAGILGNSPFTAVSSAPSPRTLQRWLLCFGLVWLAAAAVLASRGALGSIWTYAANFTSQEEISLIRADLAMDLPIFYWSLSYSLLPTLSAACIWAIQGRDWTHRGLRWLIGFATLWIVFAHFFKAQAFYYFFFLALCTASVQPKRFIRMATAIVLSTFLLVGAFYGYQQMHANEGLDLVKIAEHFMYRLGTNQYFYVLYFPHHHPWLPLDIGNLGNADNRLAFLFQYPTQLAAKDGTLAGPYISNAYAQGGNWFVLGYSLLSGYFLQAMWVFARRLEGPLRIALLGRVLFSAFLLSQMSFRDVLASGWGIVWGLLAILMLKWLPAAKDTAAEA